MYCNIGACFSVCAFLCVYINLEPYVKRTYHKSKGNPLELGSFRFFMISNEVHNMANKLKIGSALLKVDWFFMMQDAYAL